MIILTTPDSSYSLTASEFSFVRGTLEEVRVHAMSDALRPKLEYGICQTWIDNLRADQLFARVASIISVVHLMTSIVEDWDGFDARRAWRAYPIDEDCDRGRWEGRNLEQRLSLIDFMLDRFNKVVALYEEHQVATPHVPFTFMWNAEA